MRVYFKGVEIDQIPELKEICAMDDWLGALMKWLKEKHPEIDLIEVISSLEASSDDSPILEVWIGGAPPRRAMEIGGALRKLRPARRR